MNYNVQIESKTGDSSICIHVQLLFGTDGLIYDLTLTNE